MTFSELVAILWRPISAAEWSALLLSLQVSLISILLIALPGVLIAWLLARVSFRGKSFLNGLVHLPLVMPPVVVGYFLILLLGPRAWVGSFLEEQFGLVLAFHFQGAALASGIMGFPLLVRSARISFEHTVIPLEEAARTLGASPWRVFYTITLPHAWPGILSGIILAAGRSFGEFGATISFAGNIAGETRTLPLAIFSSLQSPGNEDSALRLALISILLAYVTLLAGEYFIHRSGQRS
ncbi:MAG: molybdate ABC transporter permease subunit [Leptospiraceae bacterium]|nr:molybdate ABC transporter permease subunit [Leptospiraceae bacterium]MCB1323564.1 molybdate ABC transporter permease subunit [Leptospiraceae bacterium]